MYCTKDTIKKKKAKLFAYVLFVFLVEVRRQLYLLFDTVLLY